MRARTRKVLQLTCPPPTLTVRADEALHASTPPLARLRACAARPEHPCPGCHRAEPDREAVVDINHRRGHVDSHAQQQSPPRRHAQPHVQRSAATRREPPLRCRTPKERRAAENPGPCSRGAPRREAAPGPSRHRKGPRPNVTRMGGLHDVVTTVCSVSNVGAPTGAAARLDGCHLPSGWFSCGGNLYLVEVEMSEDCTKSWYWVWG